MSSNSHNSDISDIFSKILHKSRNIFDEIDEKVSKINDKKIYDCGVLDPAKQYGVPSFIYDGLEEYCKSNNFIGYPGNKGEGFFLKSCAEYLDRNFGIELHSESQINITNGSKTDEFIFPAAFLNPGDLIICPTPGYPSFTQGARTFGFELYLTELKEENNFLIDFENIPTEIAEKAKMIWINYPNSPTGVVAPKEWLENLVNWAKKHNIIIAADEVYVDFFYNSDDVKIVSDNIKSISEFSKTENFEHIRGHNSGHSILNITTENVIAFFSLSKRSNMSSFRVGFAAGDSKLIQGLYRLKNLHDDGVPHIIQKIATNAFNNDTHVQKEIYNYCRYKWTNSFSKLIYNKEILPNDEVFLNKGGLFMWQKVPENYTDMEFANELLNQSGIVVIPGSTFNAKMNKYIRIAMSHNINFINEVEEKILSVKI
jgi:LL-diaminopimelate aminotransferase